MWHKDIESPGNAMRSSNHSMDLAQFKYKVSDDKR